MPRETFDEFDRRMNCARFQFRTPMGEVLWLYENGAVADGYYRLEDPPFDEFSRLVRQREYLKIQLAKLESVFNSMKKHIQQEAAYGAKYSNLPGASPHDVEQLRRCQADILEIRQKIKSIDDRLTPPEDKRRQENLARWDAEKRERSMQVLGQIGGINI